MISFVPLHTGHVLAIAKHCQAGVLDHLTADTGSLDALSVRDLAWAAFDGAPPAPEPSPSAAHPAPAPIGIGGVMPHWPGRAATWLVTGDMPRRAWPAVTRKVRDVLDRAHALGYRRIECEVDAEFAGGIRWAFKLGFEIESYMPGYSPEGRAMFKFVRFARAGAATGSNGSPADNAPARHSKTLLGGD